MIIIFLELLKKKETNDEDIENITFFKARRSKSCLRQSLTTINLFNVHIILRIFILYVSYGRDF